MTCDTVNSQLIDYLAGTLDEANRREIELHLSACGTCRSEAEDLRGTLDLLCQGLASHKSQELKLDSAHRHQIMKTVPGRGKLPKAWWVKAQPILNVAAVLVLMMVLLAVFVPALSPLRQASRKSFVCGDFPAYSPASPNIVTLMEESSPAESLPPTSLPEARIEHFPSDKRQLERSRENGSKDCEYEQAVYGVPPSALPETAAPAPPKRSARDGFARDDEGLAAGFEVAMAKSPLVMKGLYSGRTSGGRKEANKKNMDSSELDSIQPEDSLEEAKEIRGELSRRAGAPLGEAVALSAAKPSADSPLQDFDEKADRLLVDEPAPVYNQEIAAAVQPFSTFAIDVDTASFTRARKFLLDGVLPPLGTVRVEEFINAMEYAYPSPDHRAFAVYTDRTRSPFRSQLELLRIGVRGRVIGRDRQRTSVITLVIDTSGSMNTPDRLDLIKASLRLLLDNLSPADRLSIVTFGSEARLLLDYAPLTQKKAILEHLNSIQATGSTQLEGGLKLGYETAVKHFRSGSVNRVLLLSDGVANLGAATAEEILSQVEAARKQGVYCSVFGFGQGPYNDTMLETLADKGDGVYRFVDSLPEAREIFVNDLSANLHVIARDVKIQVEFNPARVKTYRQVGYENRALSQEQFRDDKVDAGEVGSGQSVTALYEISTQGNQADPLGTVRLRWKDAESGQVDELAHIIRSSECYEHFEQAPVRFRLAAGIAEFAEHLRRNPVVMGTDMNEVGRVIRAVGLELNLDQRVADLVRMNSAAEKLMR